MREISIKIWLPVILIFSTTLLFIIYLNWPKAKEFPEITFLKIITPKKEIPEIPSDWKTYRNEEYGFEFRYPNTWTLGKEESLIDEYNKILLMIKITKNDDPDQGFAVWIDQEDPPPLIYAAPQKESLLIDNINATAYIFPGGYECYEDMYIKLEGDCSFFEIPIKHRNLWYRLIAHKKAREVTEEYRNILSTFKFIE